VYENGVELASVGVCLEEFETRATGNDDFLLTDAGKIADDCVGDGRGVLKGQIIQMHFFKISFLATESCDSGRKKNRRRSAKLKNGWPLTRPVDFQSPSILPSWIDDDNDDNEVPIT